MGLGGLARERPTYPNFRRNLSQLQQGKRNALNGMEADGQSDTVKAPLEHDSKDCSICFHHAACT